MSDFTPAPIIRPRPCVGGLLDIPLGRYYKGKYGDNLLSGGSTNFQLTGGRGNTFKSVTSMCSMFRVLERYSVTDMIVYDTELTLGWDRLEDLIQFFPGLDYNELVESGRLILTSAGEHSGNEFWAAVRKMSNDRAKDAKRLAIETPFIDSKGNPIKVLPLKNIMVDSLSAFDVDSISEIQDKNEIDDGAAQTLDMRSVGAKSRMIVQVPPVTSRGGIHITMTAHVGDEIKVDKYAPAKQLLGFIKKGLKFKNVPEKASFLSNVTWYISNAEVYLDSNKYIMYPADGYVDVAGDTDLQKLTLINGRSKHGPAGQILNLIVSQTEGVKFGLSEFDFLRSSKDKFGLIGPEGVGKDYRLEIYPDVLIKRKQARKLIDEDKKLQRALEITTELKQIYDYWVDFPIERRVKPKDLYSKLKEMGYDWDLLLDTRGYWTHDHYTNPVKPISTMDLIDMYHGDYIPWWYDKSKLKGK